MDADGAAGVLIKERIEKVVKRFLTGWIEGLRHARMCGSDLFLEGVGRKREGTPCALYKVAAKTTTKPANIWEKRSENEIG